MTGNKHFMFRTQKRLARLEQSLAVTMASVASLQMAVIAMGGKVHKVEKVSAKKKHKKHNFFKACGTCGKAYKGNLGLSIHKKKVHGIDGKWLQK